jgi:hypothetical protein
MTDPKIKPHWSWGLGDDGILYCKGQIAGHCFKQTWWPYERMGFGIPISEMRKIVKEFGHLLVFI